MNPSSMVPDALWAAIEPLLPPEPPKPEGGRPRRSAITTRLGSCDWTGDHAGWVVMLLSPEQHHFYGRTLEEALAWCVEWLMAPELGDPPFLVH